MRKKPKAPVLKVRTPKLYADMILHLDPVEAISVRDLSSVGRVNASKPPNREEVEVAEVKVWGA